MAELRLDVKLNVNNTAAKAEVAEVSRDVDTLRQKARAARSDLAATQASAGRGTTRLPTNAKDRFEQIRYGISGSPANRAPVARLGLIDRFRKFSGTGAGQVLGRLPGGQYIGQIAGLLNPAAIAAFAVGVGIQAIGRATERQEQALAAGAGRVTSRRAALGTFLDKTLGPLARSGSRIGGRVLSSISVSNAEEAEARFDRFAKELLDPAGEEVGIRIALQAAKAEAEAAQTAIAERTLQALKLPIARVGTFRNLDVALRNEGAKFNNEYTNNRAAQLAREELPWIESSDVRAFRRGG